MLSGPEDISRLISDLHEQVMRDRWTLEHCPDPAPSVDFYADRIIDYESDIRELRRVQNERQRRKL
jgi:hypothetical protein